MQPVKLEKRRDIRGRTPEWRRTHQLDPTTSHKQVRTTGFYAVKLEHEPRRLKTKKKKKEEKRVEERR